MTDDDHRLDVDHDDDQEQIDMGDHNLDNTDAERLELLDRIEARIPEMNLEEQTIEWKVLPDGVEALLVNGGGIDGGSGVFFANAGEDVHAVGSLAPLAPAVGCIVLKPDGTRVVGGVTADPLAGQDESDS